MYAIVTRGHQTYDSCSKQNFQKKISTLTCSEYLCPFGVFQDLVQLEYRKR